MQSNISSFLSHEFSGYKLTQYYSRFQGAEWFKAISKSKQDVIIAVTGDEWMRSITQFPEIYKSQILMGDKICHENIRFHKDYQYDQEKNLHLKIFGFVNELDLPGYNLTRANDTNFQE